MLAHIFLGIIQGVTEFIPVSSSAHLIIFQRLLGIRGQELSLSLALHLGTILALLLFFFKDILGLIRQVRFLWYVFIVTLITAAIGISAKDFFENLFSSPPLVALALICTGLILIATRWLQGNKRESLNIRDTVILGLAQGMAIIPGISRSGMTISALLFSGLKRKKSFEFSFIASIPAVLGAALWEFKKVSFAFKGEPVNFALGFIFSFLAGYLSLGLLKIILARAKLYYFGYYCIFAAILVLLYLK